MRGYTLGEDLQINGINKKTLMLDYGGSKKYFVIDKSLSDFTPVAIMKRLGYYGSSLELEVSDIVHMSKNDPNPDKKLRVRSVSDNVQLHFFKLLNTAGVS